MLLSRCVTIRAPAEIVGQLTQEKFEIGDFVWVHGDVCEVRFCRTTLTNHSEFGTTAARIREIRPQFRILRDNVNLLHRPGYRPRCAAACLMQIASGETQLEQSTSK